MVRSRSITTVLGKALLLIRDTLHLYMLFSDIIGDETTKISWWVTVSI